MRKILEHQKLDMRNLISFRGKVRQEEISEVIQIMRNYAVAQGSDMAGGPISVTYGVEQTEYGAIADAEIMIQVDKKIAGNDKFAWKERLFLEDAVRLKYAGSPALFQNACSELNAYIREKRYTPITAGYILTKGIDSLLRTVDMEVYIGVSSNVL